MSVEMIIEIELERGAAKYRLLRVERDGSRLLIDFGRIEQDPRGRWAEQEAVAKAKSFKPKKITVIGPDGTPREV